MERSIVFNEIRIVSYDGETLAKTDDIDWFAEFFEENRDLCTGVIIQLYTGFYLSDDPCDEPCYVLRKEWRF